MLIMALLLWNASEMGYIYKLFRKRHLLFEDRYTKAMCMALSSVSSFVMALYLTLLLPSSAAFVPIIASVWIGWKFGSFIKAPASLNGIYNGAMGGIMGMMLGAVLQNPALCKIPIESEAMMLSNMYTLTVFCACLHALTTHFIRHSLKG